jgi:LCP family protein required for cell wall assembly
MQKTMDRMYEPLPSTQWIEPVFEQEEQPLVYIATATQSKSTSLGQATLLSAVEGADQLLHPNLDNKDPFCILLLGVDEREGDRGRSDTMILLAVQPAIESAIAISIPRDTRVLMPNSKKYDKINHAYAFGGTPLSVAAVEDLFGVPIAYYMKTNMEGLVDIVDTVGGVDVDNQRKFTYEEFSFPLGDQHLNGKETLAYVRMRKQDPQGDFGRTQRQRQVLSSAVDHVVSFRTLGKLPHLFAQLSKDVRTNLTSQDMLNLVKRYRPAIQSVDNLYIQGVGKMIDGIYYYVVQPETRQKIQEQLLNQLIAGGQ